LFDREDRQAPKFLFHQGYPGREGVRRHARPRAASGPGYAIESALPDNAGGFPVANGAELSLRSLSGRSTTGLEPEHAFAVGQQRAVSARNPP